MEHKILTTHQGTITLKTIEYYIVLDGDAQIQCTKSSKARPSKPGYHNSENAMGIIAVGDEVTYTPDPDNPTGTIIEVLPRRNHFGRRAANPKNQPRHTSEQVIAANVDQVIPVFALAQPVPSWNMLDRFLVMAEASGIPAVICINKIDCMESLDQESSRIIADYQRIGYPVIFTSATRGDGMNQFQTLLQNKTSVLVGKSGVGKSSLLNALQPGLGQRVREVGRKWMRHGRHTTTCMEMFALDCGGYIIDTPGIRELGLWDIHPDELAGMFREMQPFVGSCRFRWDCSHNEEPGCAIRKAVMAGVISPRRYKSYLRLMEEL
jgi:ribosome biogenesis GTPase / thiamine phosphate phosphatase